MKETDNQEEPLSQSHRNQFGALKILETGQATIQLGEKVLELSEGEFRALTGLLLGWHDSFFPRWRHPSMDALLVYPQGRRTYRVFDEGKGATTLVDLGSPSPYPEPAGPHRATMDYEARQGIG